MIPINPAWHGLQVFENPYCVNVILMPTWIDKVLRWNPCNDWPVTTHSEPIAYMMHGRLIAHPEIIKALKESYA